MGGFSYGHKTALDEFLRVSVPEWADDDTSKGLFSPFSQPRYVNPESYDFRMAFWKNLIMELTRRGLLNGSVFCLPHSDTISELLQRKGVKPIGIAHVVKRMISEKDAVALSDDMAFDEAGSLLLRFTRLTIGSAVRWGWSLIAGSDAGAEPGDGDTASSLGTSTSIEPVMLTSLLLDTVDRVFTVFHERRNRYGLLSAMDISEFKDLVQETRRLQGLPLITLVSDFDILIKFMKQKGLLAIRTEPKEVVKLSGDRKSVVTDVTIEEINIIKLKAMQENLRLRLERLSTQIKTTRDLARAALKAQDRDLALFELKRSKAIDVMRNQNLSSLQAIEDILDKVDSAKSMAQVFDAYRAGESTLRSIISATNVTPGQVDDLMTSLAEAINDQEILSSALATPIDISTADLSDISDRALEAELAAFVSEITPQEPVPVEPPNLPEPRHALSVENDGTTIVIDSKRDLVLE